MLISQFDKFVNRSTQEILGSDIEQENLEPMLSTDIIRSAGNVTGVKGEKEVYYRTGNVNLTSDDIGSLNVDNVYNGLDKTTEGYALDARQGKALADGMDGKLDKANIYNGLDKTTEGYALDARQGKVLADDVGALSSAMTYVVSGNKSIETATIPVGAYVRLVGSTIAGRSDGIYTIATAIPVNTVIDGTYFNESAPIPGGGLNALNASIQPNYSDLLFNGQIDNNPYTASKKSYFVAVTMSSNSVILSYSVMVNNINVSVVDSSVGPQAGVLFASGYLNPGDVLSGHAKVKVFGLA